jgi:hypothetical protein
MMMKLPPQKRTRTTTNFFSSVSFKEDTQKDIRNHKQNLKHLCYSIVNNKLFFSYGKKTIALRPADIIRAFADSELLTNQPIFRNITLNYIAAAEKKAAGSALPFVLKLFNDVEFKLGFRRSLKEEVDNCLKTYIGSGIVFDLITDIIHASGLYQTVKFKVTDTEQFVLLKSESETLPCFLHEFFKERSEESDSITVLFDGMIETVSEIDSLLNWSANNKRRVNLIGPRYSMDVINTIKHNFELNKTFVLPFVCDVESLDPIKEYCQKNSCPMVSTETGLRFNNIDYSLQQANACQIEGYKLSVNSKDGQEKTITIKIPQRFSDIKGILEDRIKFGLSIYKSACRFGVATMTINKENKLFIPNNAVKISDRLVNSWSENIEKIHCCVSTVAK